MRLNNLNESSFLKKLQGIKLFLFDLDGVLLNNIDDEDTIIHKMQEFSRILMIEGCYVGIITARSGDELTTKLNQIENCFVLTSSFDKKEKMKEKLAEMEIKFEAVFYFGDDLLDIPLLQKSGLGGAPSNARREVKRAVDVVLDEHESSDLLKTVKYLIEQVHSN